MAKLVLTECAESDECESNVWQVGVIHTPMLNGHCEKIEREHNSDDFHLSQFQIYFFTARLYCKRNSIFLESLL